MRCARQRISMSISSSEGFFQRFLELSIRFSLGFFFRSRRICVSFCALLPSVCVWLVRFINIRESYSLSNLLSVRTHHENTEKSKICQKKYPNGQFRVNQFVYSYHFFRICMTSTKNVYYLIKSFELPGVRNASKKNTSKKFPRTFRFECAFSGNNVEWQCLFSHFRKWNANVEHFMTSGWKICMRRVERSRNKPRQTSSTNWNGIVFRRLGYFPFVHGPDRVQ